MTQGGKPYQEHKIHGLFGKEALDTTEVVSSGRKGKRIATTYDSDLDVFIRQTPQMGAVHAKRTALIDDNIDHILSLQDVASKLNAGRTPDAPRVLGVLITPHIIELDPVDHSFVVQASDAAGALEKLIEYDLLPAA